MVAMKSDSDAAIDASRVFDRHCNPGAESASVGASITHALSASDAGLKATFRPNTASNSSFSFAISR